MRRADRDPGEKFAGTKIWWVTGVAAAALLLGAAIVVRLLGYDREEKEALDIARDAEPIIWDSPQRRIGLLRLEEPVYKDNYSDEFHYRLSEYQPNSFKLIRTTLVGTSEQKFDKLIGSPDEGPVILMYSYVGTGIESYGFEVIGSDFKLSPYGGGRCWGGKGDRVLASVDHGNKRGYDDLSCRSVDGKKVLWHVSFRDNGGVLSVEWRADRIVVTSVGGEVALDPLTGKQIADAPSK